MRSMKNNSNVNWSVSYNVNNEWIEDSVYADLAVAADVLYKSQQITQVNTELHKLAEIDKFVETNGTDLANAMLEEHFRG